jgi:hypothetical protein
MLAHFGDPVSPCHNHYKSVARHETRQVGAYMKLTKWLIGISCVVGIVSADWAHHNSLSPNVL